MTLNTTAAVAATTTLAVNGTRLVQVLRDAFTNPTTFVSELAQNARRSGSSCIVIDFDDTQRTFSIEDTGTGITDWSALLTIGTSGWDLETIDVENAFGIGQLSMIHAAAHVRIESSTGTLDAATDDILQMKPLSITPAVRDKGTKISLSGVKTELGSKPYQPKGFLDSLFEAYPIPVIINGKELARPYSIDALRARQDLVETQTELGHLFTPKDKLADSTTFYLQGFKVAGGREYFGSPKTTFDHSYLHITDSSVRARCPDRNQLIEADRVLKNAALSTLDADREVLKAWAQQKRFSDLYSCIERLKKADVVHLLNDADYIPASFVIELDSPHIRQYGSSGFERDRDRSIEYSQITRLQIESGELRLFDVPDLESLVFDEERHHELLVIAAYLHALKGVLADSDVQGLDEGHWARKSLEPFSAFNDDGELLLKVCDPVITAKGTLPIGSNTYTDAALAESVCIDGPFSKVLITEGLVPLESKGGSTMLCLKEKPSAYEICNYYWDDTWNTDSEERDDEKLYRFFAALEAGNATNLIKQQLIDIADTLKSFGEGQFKVRVTAKGIEVEQITAKAKKSATPKKAKS